MSEKKVWTIQNVNDEDQLIGVFESKAEALRSIALWSSLGEKIIYTVKTDLDLALQHDANSTILVELNPEENRGEGIRVLHVSQCNLNNGAGLCILR